MRERSANSYNYNGLNTTPEKEENETEAEEKENEREVEENEERKEDCEVEEGESDDYSQTSSCVLPASLKWEQLSLPESSSSGQMSPKGFPQTTDNTRDPPDMESKPEPVEDSLTKQGSRPM